jgi:regulatory protein
MDEPPSTATIDTCQAEGRNGAWRLVLSDGRELSFSADACRRAGVAPGKVIDAAFLEALERLERDVAVHEVALRLLSHRSRSGAELKTRLEMRGFAPDVAQHEIERLQQAGLIDDAAFARAWVAERRLHSPRGSRLLRYELLGKGVDPDAIEEALGELADDAIAAELAQRQARKLKGADRFTYMRKAGAYLHRKGISHETAMRALERAWPDNDE